MFRSVYTAVAIATSSHTVTDFLVIVAPFMHSCKTFYMVNHPPRTFLLFVVQERSATQGRRAMLLQCMGYAHAL